VLQGDLRDPLSLARNDKALQFLNGMLPEQMHINTLLQRLELRLLDGGRQGESERVGLVAVRLSHARDLNKALHVLYSVSGWDAVAMKLMWYVEQMRRALVGTTANEDLLRYRLSELAAAMPVPGEEENTADQSLAAARKADLREALFRFGSILEELRRASFVDGAFSGLPETVLEQVIGQAALLRVIASAQHSRDVSRFAHAFTFFATHVLEHRILQDVRVLHVINTANLTLQTVLETAEAEDFDSLYQTIALLESPRTLLQAQ
jgi:hypothetical protein